MATIVFSFGLFVMSIIFYNVEKKDGVIFTPTFLLGVPFSFLLLYTVVTDYLEPRYSDGISILVPCLSFIYLFEFFCVGQIVKFIFFYKIKKKHDNLIQKLKYVKIYYLIILFNMSIFILHYLKTFGINSNIINNLILLKKIFSTGIVGHLVNISNAIIIIIFTNEIIIYKQYKKLNKFVIMLSLVWCVFLTVATAKYMLMMFVASLMISYTNIFYRQIKFLKFAIYMTIFPILFIVVYTIRFISSGLAFSDLPFEFIMTHLEYYIVGSFYIFSKVIEYNLRGTIGFGIIFAPVINLLNLISGNALISTIANFISLGNGVKANVFTMFGAFQYETGIFGTILLIGLISVLIFCSYYKALNKPTVPKIALYSYLGSSLIVSFFNAFYGTLNMWEIVITIMIISFFECFRFIRKDLINLK